MQAILAHLSMVPKWFSSVLVIFIINLIFMMTVFFNLTWLLCNLAMLFAAYSIREFRYNKLNFGLCLFLSISFVIIAMKAYPI